MRKYCKKAVRCIETGEEFENITHVAKMLGRSVASVSNHLAGRTPNVKGLHFETIEKRNIDLRGFIQDCIDNGFNRDRAVEILGKI
jgi:predicted transcriptional regulator